MEPETLSVVIKRQGSWSQKLYQEISSSVDRLEMSVEGPYGPTSSHFLRSISYKGKMKLYTENCTCLCLVSHAHQFLFCLDTGMSC